MEAKNRYLFLEFLFTFLLLEPLIFLFGDALSPYRIYFTLCLAAGFSFSWLNRNKEGYLKAILMNLLVLGVFAWIVYSLLNSSLIYREVLMIFIKGGLILEVIFSFGSYNPLFLSYSQALSLPLLLCFPIFIKDYSMLNAILVLSYIICWIFILRIKFYQFLKPQPLKEGRHRQRTSIIISVVLFLIIIFLSWLLLHRLLLGKVEKEGFLLEEAREAEVESQTLEKEYYAQQDKVQEEISELIPKLDSRQERQEMLFLLSVLIKDTSIVAETRKAESALINRMKVPGPGIEKAKGDDIAIQIKDYLNKKAQFNLINIREEIINKLKKNKLNIMTKFSIMNRINKMQGAGSNQEIKGSAKELRRIINRSSARANAKSDLRNSIKKFREWKTLEAYRRKTDSLKKKLESMDKELRKIFEDLLSDIDSIADLQDFKDAKKKLKRIKETTPPAEKDLVSQAEEILGLKSEMLLSEKARDSQEKIDNLNLPRNESQELKEKIDDIKDAGDSCEFLKSRAEYQEKIKENRVSEDKKTKEFSETKAGLIFDEKEDKIEDELKKSNLPDKGEKLIKDLEKLGSEKKREELIADSEKLKEDIEKLSKQGFIPEASKDNLKKEIEEIKDLFKAGLEAEKEAERRDASVKTGQADFRDKWEELIEKSSLKKEKKEALKQLGKELSKAETIPNVENIKKVTYETIEKLSMDGVKKEESEKIKDAFDEMVEAKRKLIIEKSLAELRDKIEDLKRVDPREAQEIERFLEKIRDSRTNEELKKEVDALKDYLDSKKQEQGEEKKPEEIKETGNLEIIILPPQLIIPMGSSPSLKAVAIYNKVFIKEVGPQLDWYSSEPYIAWVDDKGTVHPSAKGKAEIYAVYSGKESQKIEITVVDRIDEQVGNMVESESIKANQ